MFFIYFCFKVYECFGCIHACAILVPVKVRKEHQMPEGGVTESYGQPCGCWELNLGTLELQTVPFTTVKVALDVSLTLANHCGGLNENVPHGHEYI